MRLPEAMIHVCTKHDEPIQWNDETVPKCPLCNEMTLEDLRKLTDAEMRHLCGSCGEPFINDPKWWAQHGNICYACTHSKISPEAAKEKAPQRVVPRGKIAEAFVELFDKQPTALELEQFKPWYRARKKAARYENKDE